MFRERIKEHCGRSAEILTLRRAPRFGATLFVADCMRHGRLVRMLGSIDRTGRITVEPDLGLPGDPAVLALGDMVRVRAADGTITPLPGLAPVAMQQGRYAARVVRGRLRGRTPRAFHYTDKGNLATIGRSKAVADVKGLHLAGFAAWVMWLLVHLFYLIGFQNRLLVMLRWTISFVTRGRGSRLIVRRSETQVGSRSPATG